MATQQISNAGPTTEPRLTLVGQPLPELISDHSALVLLLRVAACGVCHTDLHLVEGALPHHKRPVIPGH